MVELTIGGISVGKWATGYSVDVRPVTENNDFKSVSGNYIPDKIGDEVILDITLEEIPEDVSKNVATALQAKTVDVSYTTPSLRHDKFYSTSYKAECEGGNPENEWKIYVTLHSAGIVSSGSETGADGL